MTPTLALKIASQAHLGQVDKLGHDYITHPTRVAARFAEDSNLQAIAYLHDVLEDCAVTEESLRALFPDHIVDAVVAMTKQDGQLYEDYLEQVKANELALAVKLADIEDNMSRIDKLPDQATRQRLSEKYHRALQELIA